MTAPRRKSAKPGARPRGGKPPAPRKGGPDTKAEAMRLLGEGYKLAAVARECGVSRETVRDWRDSPEGARLLAAARADRAAYFAGSIEDARRIFREAIPRAAQALVDKLDSAVPFEDVAAASAILDRVGMPRTTVVETPQRPTLDASKWSNEELDQYEALRRKATVT